MKFEELKKEMQSYLLELDMDLSDKQITQFYDYMNLLIEWNKVMNLTGIIEPKEIIIKVTKYHFKRGNLCVYDSIVDITGKALQLLYHYDITLICFIIKMALLTKKRYLCPNKPQYHGFSNISGSSDKRGREL